MPARVVITGGPGAGKSTLVDRLAADGWPVVAESGRAIIIETIASGGSTLPWVDPAAFAAAWASAVSPVTVFDRGIVDTVGYLRLSGLPVPRDLARAARNHRYDAVLVAPFWSEIYTTDTERRQTPQEAIATEHAIRAAYVEHGYTLVDLPFVDVDRRARFTADRLRDATPPSV